MVASTVVADSPGARAMSAQLTVEMQACINTCQSCHAICIETVPHCLSMGGEHAEPAHIGTLLDCADLCITAADFMSRGSPVHPSTCALCADACIRCAEECERLGENDVQMQRCAQLCRQCAESCREMALAEAA